MQNAPRGAFCNTMAFIKLPFVIKIFVLSIFEWQFYTGFTVLHDVHSENDIKPCIKIDKRLVNLIFW